MKRRHAALTAASAFAAITLAAAVLAGLYSCNFLMPSANYPIMRQEKGFSLLRVYTFQTYEKLDELSFGFGALDGITSMNGIGSPNIYLSVRNRYSKEGKLIHLYGTIIDFLDRNLEAVPHNPVFLDEKRTSYDSASGFITTDGSNIINIENDTTPPYILPTVLDSISNIESYADIISSPLRGFSGNVFPGTIYRGLFDEGTALSVQSIPVLPSGATHTVIARYPNAMDTIVAGFTRLTDTAYPNSAFWNPGKAEIRRLGFTESGSFTWFEAVRRDDIADDEEALLVAMKDSGSALTVKPLAAAGTADKYVLAWEKKEAPGFRLAVLDSSLNAVNKISIYGIDTVYLGEALVVVEGISQNAALFATLGVRASGSSDMREVVISIFAYPTAYLRDGPP